jgi:CRP-like cAMP-binding protein
MKRDGTVALLRGVWLFESCSRAELTTLARTTTSVGVPAGKVLAHEGEIGREFFVVVSGRVEATRSGTHVASLGPGEFFGEMALLDRQPRAATVTAVEPSELLVLTRPEFIGVIEAIPTVDRKIIAVLAQRIRELEDRFLPQERYADVRRAGNGANENVLSVDESSRRSRDRSAVH